MGEKLAMQPAWQKASPRLVRRYLTREALGLVVMGAALFWSAGRLDWWPGWAVLLVMAAWIAATFLVMLRTNPALIAERLGPRPGSKGWDTAILSLLGLVQLARYVVAGLDARHGWSGSFSVGAQVLALGLCLAGYALVTWSTAANAFFSQIVRIQTERGQHVVSGGPYRYVRHPGYAGAILFEFAAGVLLSSWWALLAGAASALLLVLRTALEDRLLQAELPGYMAYARRTRFRLLPGIW
jgi:protein-S-isoprenylcysteine O-methyltransferase Ste14